MSTVTPAERSIDYAGTLPLTARQATLNDLAEMLRTQHARKLDVVAPATAIRSEDGLWVIDGAAPIIDADGVTDTAGRYAPTDIANEWLSAKLDIPRAYLKRLHANRTDLYDANVNGWLHGRDGLYPDDRRFMVRCFRPDEGGVGIARALLSDRYRVVDNLDVLTAALDGVRQAGADIEVEACDLTTRRMMVRIAAPSVAQAAPLLLGDYRSPFTGNRGADNPVVSAGLVISNSETGGGAFTITPRLRVEVCKNGMTVTRDALRSVHLGGKLEEGVVEWSDDTQQKNLALVTSQTRDAVTSFLDTDYLQRKIREMSEWAGVEIEKPADTIEHVAKTLRYGQEATDAILDHFIRGGDTSAVGVMQAVTSYAQTVKDGETAADIEGSAFEALELAAR